MILCMKIETKVASIRLKVNRCSQKALRVCLVKLGIYLDGPMESKLLNPISGGLGPEQSIMGYLQLPKYYVTVTQVEKRH